MTPNRPNHRAAREAGAEARAVGGNRPGGPGSLTEGETMNAIKTIMRWDELPDQAQEDLLEWFNCALPDAIDKRRLAALYFEGLFHAWDCPLCSERIYHGEPEDWDHFQGAQEMDTESYPGLPEVFTEDYIARLCDSCRMTGLSVYEQGTREDTGI